MQIIQTTSKQTCDDDGTDIIYSNHCLLYKLNDLLMMMDGLKPSLQIIIELFFLFRIQLLIIAFMYNIEQQVVLLFVSADVEK